MKNIYFLIILMVFLLSSCSTMKTIKFTQKSNEVQTTDALSLFLSKVKNPKVVLRVRETSNNVTDKENNDYLYNAIENQLMASGFIVRDRQLFNQIIGNAENNVNYENLNKKSDTDLIIELTKLDRSVLYETNKYFDSNGNEKADEFNGPFRKYGATVEFKVVLIKNNQFAGLYDFNYTPCTDGCVIAQSFKDVKNQIKTIRKTGIQPYEGVEKNELEEFIKAATRNLVAEIRK
ncbi:hypothetical protein [Chryseobacterium sp. MDT2-18]|uniref:hypothetical protein n=1 Tax=Chryseobacterium sp. MDT2-18 TaxID=1259136 RepID=UPI00278328DD|nr:hypothetical protein [Chryseobacterium sp. MDT2-18]MDQ0476207.1 hypothetical protein [Chryseobacterium sp. MDT2-18]